jgi:hypothetical protein
MCAEVANASAMAKKTSSIGFVTRPEKSAWANTFSNATRSVLVNRYVHLYFVVVVTTTLVINSNTSLV